MLCVRKGVCFGTEPGYILNFSGLQMTTHIYRFEFGALHENIFHKLHRKFLIVTETYVPNLISVSCAIFNALAST